MGLGSNAKCATYDEQVDRVGGGYLTYTFIQPTLTLTWKTMHPPPPYTNAMYYLRSLTRLSSIRFTGCNFRFPSSKLKFHRCAHFCLFIRSLALSYILTNRLQMSSNPIEGRERVGLHWMCGRLCRCVNVQLCVSTKGVAAAPPPLLPQSHGHSL